MGSYEFLKTIHKATDNQPEEGYFKLLGTVLGLLDTPALQLGAVELWAYMHLLLLEGHAPNLKTDKSGHKLEAATSFGFEYETMAFVAVDDGEYSVNDIKLLRLVLGHSEKILYKISIDDGQLYKVSTLVKAAQRYVRA